MIWKIFLKIKSASLDSLHMVCVMRSFEKTEEDNEERLQSEACEQGFQRNVFTKNEGHKKRLGRVRVKVAKIMSVSVITW
jgi:hypothetical protein